MQASLCNQRVIQSWITKRQFVESSKWVKAEVIFGAPKLGCKGTGICRVMMAKPNGVKATIPCGCPLFSVQFRGDDQGAIWLAIDLKEIRSGQLEAHFEDGQFIVTENVDIPAFIRKVFPDALRTIKVGIYPVYCAAEKYFIRFK